MFLQNISQWAKCFNTPIFYNTYVLWHPDPESKADAFNLSWAKPFSLVAKSISKIIQEKASGIMVIPWWLTQNWYPIMTQSSADYRMILLQKKTTLTLPLHKNKSYLLFPEIQLLAILLSGKQWEIESLQRKLFTSSVSPGEAQQFLDMTGHSESGKTIEAKGMLIPLIQVWRLCWIFFMVYMNVDVGALVFAQPKVRFLVL